jgi:hypothetical protein
MAGARRRDQPGRRRLHFLGFRDDEFIGKVFAEYRSLTRRDGIGCEAS